MRYVALLRGIGPMNPNMRNEKLRGVVEALGYANVETVISTGNVLFDADVTDPAGVAALEQRIERAWPEQLGFRSTTIVRSAEQLRHLLAVNPFGDLEHGKVTSLDVTFLKRPPAEPLELPHTSAGGDYSVVAMVDDALCSVIDLRMGRTPDLMRWLERRLGKEITTRTWTTVRRILERMDRTAGS